MSNVERSIMNVQVLVEPISTFDIRHSTFDVRRSTFDIRYYLLHSSKTISQPLTPTSFEISRHLAKE
jgi:hypothetical protein